MSIHVKRAYDPPARNDGYRVLVDRIWPRGVSREKAKIDEWLKQIAPSTKLRQWFGHDPEKWDEFKRRYFKELKAHAEELDELSRRAGWGRVTLVYAAKDEDHNNAVALREFLAEGRG